MSVISWSGRCDVLSFIESLPCPRWDLAWSEKSIVSPGISPDQDFSNVFIKTFGISGINLKKIYPKPTPLLHPCGHLISRSRMSSFTVGHIFSYSHLRLYLGIPPKRSLGAPCNCVQIVHMYECFSSGETVHTFPQWSCASEVFLNKIFSPKSHQLSSALLPWVFPA